METEMEKGYRDTDCCCRAPQTDFVFGCAEKKVVLTPREQAVLKRIREAAAEARAVKAELRALDATPLEKDPGRNSAMERLESLRLLRRELEAERVAAGEERMRLLGH